MRAPPLRVWTAVAAALVVAIGVVTAGGVAASQAEPGDRARIRALLERRARAVLEQDRASFAATMSDDSPRFVARQMSAFDALEEVPLRTYELVPRWGRAGDLARKSEWRRYAGAEDVVTIVVEERYRIAGYDAAPAAEDLFLTFVLRRGRWLVGGDDDLEDLGLYSARHLWDFGPVEAAGSRHFLLLGHPCDPCALAARDILARAEEAVAEVDDGWPLRWRKRVVLLVPESTEELGRMIQATVELDDFVAFAYSTIDMARDYALTGYRVILNPEAMVGRSRARTRFVLVHELAHIATRPLSGPMIPAVIEEGQAELVASISDSSALAYFDSLVAAGAVDGRLPADHHFQVGTGTEIFASYQKALSAARFFVDRYGLDRFTRFYRRLGAQRIVAGTARYHVERALEATTGSSLRKFERAWADSIGR